MTTAATHIAEPYGEGKVLIRDVELFAGYDPEIDDSREDADEMRKWDDEKVREVVDRTKFYMLRGAYPKLVKLHQREGQDTPDESFGDIVEIRYEGRSGVPMIVGDIVVSEQTFKRDIASGAFPRRSAEIWPDGYLSEVALLGRETPARPLPDMRFSRNATTGAAPMVFVRNVEPATFAFDESKIKRAKDGKFATKEEREAAAASEEKGADTPGGNDESRPANRQDRDEWEAIDFVGEILDGRMEIGDAAVELAGNLDISVEDAEEIIEQELDAVQASINRNAPPVDENDDDDDDEGGWDGAGTGFEYGPDNPRPEPTDPADEFESLDEETKDRVLKSSIEAIETMRDEPEFDRSDAIDYLATEYGISENLAGSLIDDAETDLDSGKQVSGDDDPQSISADFDGIEDDARDLASQVRDGSLDFEDAIESLSIDFMISEGDAADFLQTAIDSWESVESGSQDLADAGRSAIDAMPDPSRFTPEELQEQGRKIIDAAPDPSRFTPEELQEQGRRIIDGEMSEGRAIAEEILRVPHIQDAIETVARRVSSNPLEGWAEVEALTDAIWEDQAGGGRKYSFGDLRAAVADSVGASDRQEYLEAEEEYIRKADRMRGDGYSSLHDPKSPSSKRRSERFNTMKKVADAIADSLASGDMDFPDALKAMRESFPNASTDLVLGALNDARRRSPRGFSRRGRKQTFAATYPGAGNTTTPAYGDEDMNPVDDDREIMSRLEELEETYGRSRFAKACRGRYERDEDEEAETFGLAEADEEKLGYQRSRKGRAAVKSARSTDARRREFARRLAAMKAAPQRDAALKRMNARLAALESRNNALRAELDRAEFSRAIDQMEAEGFRFNGQREAILDDIVGSRDPEGRMEFYRSVLPQAPIGQRIPTTGVRINQTAGAMSEDKIQFAREKAKAKAIASRGTDNPITYSEAFDEIVASMSKEA